MDSFKAWLTGQGMSADYVAVVAALSATAILLALSVLVHWIARRIIVRIARGAARRTQGTWDDALVEARVFSRLAHVAPALVIHSLASVAYRDFPGVESGVRSGVFVYVALVGMMLVEALLTALARICEDNEFSRKIPVRVIAQVLKLVTYFAGAVAIVALLVGKSPLIFFSGMGAFSAVLLLVFKDPLLGLIAGIQLTTYNMVQVGDWIEMPNYHADGDVIDVSLTTVKVQNWDKTITTIPTYALVSDSFRNWRGMSESGGRRIKRALHLDVTSIKFCDREMIERFQRIRFITEYVNRTIEELNAYNKDLDADTTLLANGRHMTNVGTFRAYLEAYLRNLPMIRQDMTFLVRQLAPTERGLPIEIYVFSKEQGWIQYEKIQADIFDHILAILPLFDLRVFQAPTGADLRALGQDAARRPDAARPAGSAPQLG